MSLKAKIESLLFVAVKSMSSKELANVIKVKAKDIDQAVEELIKEYKEKGSGITIIKNNAKYQITTIPENAVLVKDFLQDETSGDLSQPSLEALSIIAYRGPISKMELEKIRGVNCSLIIRNLLMRGLVEEKFDRSKNEHYYSVTHNFIRFLGINDVKDLSNYEKLNKMETITQALEENLSE